MSFLEKLGFGGGETKKEETPEVVSEETTETPTETEEAIGEMNEETSTEESLSAEEEKAE